MVASLGSVHYQWDFNALPVHQEACPVQRCARDSFRCENRLLFPHCQRSFGCVENVTFMEVYPITTIFLTIITGGLAIIPLSMMRAERVVEGCMHQGHQRRKETAPFIQQHPMTTLFLTVVTGGLALLILPFITTSRMVDRCEGYGHIVRHVEHVPFIAEYPLTSLFLACTTGGLALFPLAFMKATRSLG